jgi:hypothetical protein
VNLPTAPFPLPTALIFDGSTNPAHPKHIGSIDPNCSVSDVVKGEPPHHRPGPQRSSRDPSQIARSEGDPFPADGGGGHVSFHVSAKGTAAGSASHNLSGPVSSQTPMTWLSSCVTSITWLPLTWRSRKSMVSK